MNESKNLRRNDFPDSIGEGFRQLEKCDYSRVSQEKIASIVDELIFCEYDRRVSRKRHLTPVKELQMLEKIASYFWEHRNDAQHVIFLWLFMPGKKLSPVRFSVLTKLVSLAIADSNSNILNYTAVWMQMSGLHSEIPCSLTDALAKDHFTLVPGLTEYLKHLPAVSPLFCCAFLSSLTFIYRASCPPCEIIHLTLDWLSSPTPVCFAATGTVTPHTPLPGLIHWSTVAPILVLQQEAVKLIPLISQLHLKVLKLIEDFGRSEQCRKIMVISPDTVAHLLSESRHRGMDIRFSIDRVAQTLQVALSSGCLQDCPELFQILREVPRNRLLDIVTKHWKLV